MHLCKRNLATTESNTTGCWGYLLLVDLPLWPAGGRISRGSEKTKIEETKSALRSMECGICGRREITKFLKMLLVPLLIFLLSLGMACKA
jgi:hypothetical protein